VGAVMTTILRTIKSYPELNSAIVAIRKDQYCFATDMVPNLAIQAGFISVEDMGNSFKVIANTDLVMLVESPYDSGNKCKNILFVRMDLYKDHLLGFLGPNLGPKAIPEKELNKVIPLLFGNESYIRYQVLGKGGVCGALVYKFEVGIPNIYGSGTTLWILSKDEYAKLKNPPPVTAGKPMEVKKDLVNDDAAAKKAITKLAIDSHVAIRLAIRARVVAIRLANEANEAEDAANAASKVATTAFTAYSEAVAKATNKTA